MGCCCWQCGNGGADDHGGQRRGIVTVGVGMGMAMMAVGVAEGYFRLSCQRRLLLENDI